MSDLCSPVGSPLQPLMIPERPKNPSPLNLEERVITLESQLDQMKKRITQVITSIGASDDDEDHMTNPDPTFEARIVTLENELEKLRDRFRSLLWALEYV